MRSSAAAKLDVPRSGSARTRTAPARRGGSRVDSPYRARRYSGPAGGVASARTAAAETFTVPAPRSVPSSIKAPSIKAPSIKPLVGAMLGGRAWIGLLACLLIGIVTMQVALLKLNNRTGDALERGAALQRENAVLGIENSEGRAAEAVEARAHAAGMEMTGPGDLRFLQRDESQAEAAARALRAFVVPSGSAGLTDNMAQASQSFTTLASGETAATGAGG